MLLVVRLVEVAVGFVIAIVVLVVVVIVAAAAGAIVGGFLSFFISTNRAFFSQWSACFVFL